MSTGPRRRRQTRNVTGIRGTGVVNASVVWRVFECGRPGCEEIFKISEHELLAPGAQATLTCGRCGYQNQMAQMLLAPRWKYCRVCERLQPIDNFDRHARFPSGRQLECKHCKKLINAVLNPLRTRDQHREASERRRLYGILAGEGRIDEGEVYRRFENRCFNCDRPLKRGEGRVDHTLPARYLWPSTTGPTLLCQECNGDKADAWPSEFYQRGVGTVDPDKLRRLSVRSEIPYALLAGPPRLNPQAVEWLKNHVDEFIERWIRYPDEIRRLRRLVLSLEGIDVFQGAAIVPDFLREENEADP